MDFGTGFSSGKAEAVGVTLEDDSAVENVSTKGGLEKGGGVVGKLERLKSGELVNSSENIGSW